MQLKKIISFIEEWAVPELALAEDSIGLQVGQTDEEVKKILTCLTLTSRVLDQALRQKIDLIVSHHPLIFTPLGKIDFSEVPGRFIKILVENKISFYNAHTNLDAAVGGVNDRLAELAGLEPRKCRVLWPTYQEQLYKLVVYVPKKFSEKVRLAIGSAGAGGIGLYDFCTFTSSGMGTFRPLEGSRPFLGQKGRLGKVREDKLETIVSEFNLARVLEAMKKVHPYEEVAYDLYPLANPGRVFGLGRAGEVAKAITLNEFLKKLKKYFQKFEVYPAKKSQKPGNEKIKKIAVASGSGGRMFLEAAKFGAQVFLTGELKYHEILEANELSLSVILVGHEASEKIIVPVLADYLKEKTNLSIITAS